MRAIIIIIINIIMICLYNTIAICNARFYIIVVGTTQLSQIELLFQLCIGKKSFSFNGIQMILAIMKNNMVGPASEGAENTISNSAMIQLISFHRAYSWGNAPRTGHDINYIKTHYYRILSLRFATWRKKKQTNNKITDPMCLSILFKCTAIISKPWKGMSFVQYHLIIRPPIVLVVITLTCILHMTRYIRQKLKNNYFWNVSDW